MPHGPLADIVALVHFSFIVYVVAGGFLAWRWGWTLYAHLASAAYGLGIVVIGWTCPLTPIERDLRRRAGEDPGEEGFVERWIEGVIYPGELTPHMRVLAATVIAVSWAGLLWRRRRAPVRVRSDRDAPEKHPGTRAGR